jgi:hypothetical protein
MNRRALYLIFAAVILFFVSACSGGKDDNSPAVPTVQTISWQTDTDGFLQYSTNDSTLYNTHKFHTNNTIQSTMSSVEAQVKRISGSTVAGFGIAFCYQNGSDSYGIVINTQGQYLIIKVVAGVSTYYAGGLWSATQPSPWPTSSHLNTGLGSINVIKVVNMGSGNFNVYFNGSYETSFTDTTFTGGDSGYGLFISDAAHENFPSTPSDVRFKQIAPDLSTAYSVQRILWQNDINGFAQFLTNDTNDCGMHLQSISPAFTPMNSVEMQVKKITGYSHNSYGPLFCYQDNNNFYRIGITVNGFYIIEKRAAGTYYFWDSGSWTTTNPSWPTSSHLITGLGNINSIKVVNTGSGNFDVYFNGTKETSFTDTSFTGGYNGYSASVASVSQESFPTPEDVRIKLISAD